MERFSILIPTWNNLDYLKLCVDSIRRNSNADHEILVHINEGTDGTLEWVKQQAIKYTFSSENIGICFALNGLRPLVSTDYIVYMNDDMYVCPNWDTALYSHIQKIGTKLFFLSSTCIQPAASSNRKNCSPEGHYGTTVGDFQEQQLLKEYTQYETTDWMGSTIPPNIVHRDTWDLVGGYSIEFSPGMGSDPDFSAKLWLAGVREFRGIGNSLAYHFMSKSIHRVRKNSGSLQFLRKYGITIRTFQQDILSFDDPVTSKKDNRRQLSTDILRSRFKRMLTFFKDDGRRRLWDDLT